MNIPDTSFVPNLHSLACCKHVKKKLGVEFFSACCKQHAGEKLRVETGNEATRYINNHLCIYVATWPWVCCSILLIVS